MESGVKIVYIASEADIEKLSVKVTTESVAYQPLGGVSNANFRIAVVYPTSEYLYQQVIRMKGDAVSSTLMQFQFKDTAMMNAQRARLQELAVGEVNSIKTDVKNLLATGVPKVSLNISEVLERIITKARTPQGR